MASLNAIEAPPRPFQGLGRSLHGAYCIAQLGVICYIKFVSARPLPCVAWELPSTLASLNAIKAPPQALPGPGEEPSWCAQSTKQEYHEASSPGLSRAWRGGFCKCQGLRRSLHAAYCIAQGIQQEHHEANSPGPGELASC